MPVLGDEQNKQHSWHSYDTADILKLQYSCQATLTNTNPFLWAEHNCWAAAAAPTRDVLLQWLHQQGEQEWFLTSILWKPIGLHKLFSWVEKN